MASLRAVRSWVALVFLFVLLVAAGVAEARIAIRMHGAPYDEFFFHGNYSAEPFQPSDGIGIEIWNCVSGEVPTFVADRLATIVCRQSDGTTTPGSLAYAADVPPGSCVDHGRSCYYRNPDVPFRADGVRSLRIQYARRHHGNRVWLESYGDLSAADQANMLIVIKVNGLPRATLDDTFTPLPNGGWYSPF